MSVARVAARVSLFAARGVQQLHSSTARFSTSTGPSTSETGTCDGLHEPHVDGTNITSSHAAADFRAGGGSPLAPSDAATHDSHGSGSWQHMLPSVDERDVTSPLRAQLASAVQSAAESYDALHAVSGLPWWAVIPLTTIALRSALLPFSLLQSRIVRSNVDVYRQAQRIAEGEAAHLAAAAPSLAPGAPVTPAEDRTAAAMRHYRQLRRTSGAPHLGWLLVNPLVQIPTFLLANVALRGMCHSGWAGFSTEGLWWFPDLTQAALVLGGGSLSLPLGACGLLLPAAILALGVTSLRLAFGATGGKLSTELVGPTLGAALQWLPVLLYGLVLANTYWTTQLPHGVLLHWLASGVFTLGLQKVLQLPAARALLLGHPAPAKPPSVMGDAAVAEGGRTPVPPPLPPDLVQRVTETQDADVLVVLGAKQSARRRYREALYCLTRALELDPHHVRGHYSAGQVHSLTFNWSAAEASFRAAALLAPEGTPEQGQAEYCLGTALHQQGRVTEAVASYRQAAQLWPQQSVVVLMSLARALVTLGGPLHLAEAQQVVQTALERDAATPHRAFRTALLQLQLEIQSRK